MGVYVFEVFKIITYFNLDISLLRVVTASLVLPHLVSLTPDVTINSTGTWASIKIIFQFSLTTVVVTGILDTILVKILDLRKGIWGFISESLLMLVFFYLYVLIYSIFFDGISIQNYGYLYISVFLFIMYLLLHVTYWLSKLLYEKMVKKA
jgi:hypothetical protein